jgi:hypothetical protein
MTFGRIPLFSTEQDAQFPLLSDQDVRQIVVCLRSCLSDITLFQVFRGCSESSYVIVAIAAEEVADGFAAHTEKLLLEAEELKHLFPAQVRFHALGKLCRGKNRVLDKYFAATTDIHSPFVDVLILPSGWRLRPRELSELYYSSTPNYLQVLAGEQPLYSV